MNDLKELAGKGRVPYQKLIWIHNKAEIFFYENLGLWGLDRLVLYIVEDVVLRQPSIILAAESCALSNIRLSSSEQLS